MHLFLGSMGALHQLRHEEKIFLSEGLKLSLLQVNYVNPHVKLLSFDWFVHIHKIFTIRKMCTVLFCVIILKKIDLLVVNVSL